MKLCPELSFKFRLVKERDLKKIFEIEQAAFKRDAYSLGFLYLLYKKLLKPLRFFRLKKMIHMKQNACIVAVNSEDDEKLLGYIIANVHKEKKLGHILTIAVQPENQNQGIGSCLLKHLEKALKEQSIVLITLEVRKSNEKVIRFYKHAGYQKKAISRNYYADGEDAVVMMKNI